MNKQINYLIKLFLLPFSAIFALLTAFRNLLYDKRILPSKSFPIPIISVGNLSVGGTGKTPHIEYLIKLLRPNFKLATLSRGYKRRTSGFLIADQHSNAELIGDEPFQIKKKFGDITVAVGENRVKAIETLIQQDPQLQVILLDDAFQHRQVQPQLSILLTDYHTRFTHDLPLPAGRLREGRAAYKRADIILVTKCPETLSPTEKQSIRSEINPLSHQTLFFSYYQYGRLYPVFDAGKMINLQEASSLTVLLVCGIANPQSITDFVKSHTQTMQTLFFADHHPYSLQDLTQISECFNQISSNHKIIITTEKDATRLLPFKQDIQDLNLPIYCLPIEVVFLPEDEEELKRQIYQVLPV